MFFGWYLRACNDLPPIGTQQKHYRHFLSVGKVDPVFCLLSNSREQNITFQKTACVDENPLKPLKKISFSYLFCSSKKLRISGKNMENNSSDVIEVGNYVIVQRHNYKKLYKVTENGTLKYGSDHIDTSGIIGKPYWTTFDLVPSKKDKKLLEVQVKTIKHSLKIVIREKNSCLYLYQFKLSVKTDYYQCFCYY